jgi:hypothetical protein
MGNDTATPSLIATSLMSSALLLLATTATTQKNYKRHFEWDII